jgi:hypothetical protein
MPRDDASETCRGSREQRAAIARRGGGMVGGEWGRTDIWSGSPQADPVY